MALGELPRDWAASRSATRTWTGLLGLLLLAPFAFVIGAGLLRGLGVSAPIDWIGSSSLAIIAASISLIFGIPITIALNLWRITRVGVRRRHGEVEGLFVAHPAADSYACWNGVCSAR